MDYSSKNTTADEKKRGDGAASKISAGTSSKITSSSSYSSTDASKVSTGGSTSSSSSSSKITKPNSLVEDVWSQLVNQGSNPTTNGGNDNEKDGSENKIFTADSKETFLLFVGSKSSGKSTLINKFLSPNKKDKPKPTVAMEYTFGRRSSSGSGKDIAHIWELGGGKKLSDLVSVPIDPERLSSLVGIIVLDLSIPSKALQSALWWVDLIQTRVRTCLDKLRGTRPGQRTADQILQKSRERLPTNHRDVNDIDVCPIPLVIVANKYDLFANEDPAKRRVLMSALRFIAHTSGASLYCTSSRDKTLSAHYRSMMNNACFGIAPQRGTQLDPSKPVICNFGSDSLTDIGSPPGASKSEYESGRNTRLGKWKAAVEDSNIYPAEDDDMMDAILADVDTGAWLEGAVDSCRAERDDALVRYRKEVERKARLNA